MVCTICFDIADYLSGVESNLSSLLQCNGKGKKDCGPNVVFHPHPGLPTDGWCCQNWHCHHMLLWRLYAQFPIQCQDQEPLESRMLRSSAGGNWSYNMDYRPTHPAYVRVRTAFKPLSASRSELFWFLSICSPDKVGLSKMWKDFWYPKTF